MNFYFQFAVCATIILIFIPHGLSIKCWNCRSDNDPKCGDPHDNTTMLIKDCNRDKGFSPGISSSMCRKIRQLRENGEWSYIRDCAFLAEGEIQSDESLCFNRTGTDNILTEYCTCNNKDGCNSSFNFTPKPLLLFTIAAVTTMVTLLS